MVAQGPSAAAATRFQAVSYNRKLSPVKLVDDGGQRLRPLAVGPFCCSTYVSIEATCPSSCPFKGAGCFVDAGFTRIMMEKMDRAAAGLDSLSIARMEALRIEQAFMNGRIPQDGARGGRDLRLHVGGDVTDMRGAMVLAHAAKRWRERGGGAVWTYTHSWQFIPREAWGRYVSVLASVEAPEDIERARRSGYAAAIVVRELPGKRATRIAGTTAKVIPCPAETSDTTCVECRLCLDRNLLAMNAAIAFGVHGKKEDQARKSLPVLQETSMNLTDLNRASLRLEISDGEVPCPKKGTIAKARCEQFQDEMQCTCAVAVARGCNIVDLPEPVAEPVAAVRAPPPGGFDAFLAKKRGTDDCGSCGGSGVQRERVGKVLLTNPCKACKPALKGREAIEAAMASDPARRWEIDDLVPVHGGKRTQVVFDLTELSIGHKIRRRPDGGYHWNAPSSASPSLPRRDPAAVVGETIGASQARSALWLKRFPAPPSSPAPSLADAAPTPLTEPAVDPKPAHEEAKMSIHTGATDRIIEALKEAAPKMVPTEALHGLHGGRKDAFGVLMRKLVLKDVAERVDGGFKLLTLPSKAPSGKLPKTRAAKPRTPAPKKTTEKAVVAGPSTSSTPHVRSVDLNSGGRVTVTISTSVFDLSEDDRKFVFGIVDALSKYDE